MWDDVAAVMASRTQAISISRGNMIVNATDSVILHTLSLYKKKYIEKINLLAGKNVIKDIIFRVGKVEKRELVLDSRKDYVDKFQEVPLDKKDVERIDEIVSTVKDDEMRDLLRGLFINQSKLTKMRGGIGC